MYELNVRNLGPYGNNLVRRMGEIRVGINWLTIEDNCMIVDNGTSVVHRFLYTTLFSSLACFLKKSVGCFNVSSIKETYFPRISETVQLQAWGIKPGAQSSRGSRRSWLCASRVSGGLHCPATLSLSARDVRLETRVGWVVRMHYSHTGFCVPLPGPPHRKDSEQRSPGMKNVVYFKMSSPILM